MKFKIARGFQRFLNPHIILQQIKLVYIDNLSQKIPIRNFQLRVQVTRSEAEEESGIVNNRGEYQNKTKLA